MEDIHKADEEDNMFVYLLKLRLLSTGEKEGMRG